MTKQKIGKLAQLLISSTNDSTVLQREVTSSLKQDTGGKPVLCITAAAEVYREFEKDDKKRNTTLSNLRTRMQRASVELGLPNYMSVKETKTRGIYEMKVGKAISYDKDGKPVGGQKTASKGKKSKSGQREHKQPEMAELVNMINVAVNGLDVPGLETFQTQVSEICERRAGELIEELERKSA